MDITDFITIADAHLDSSFSSEETARRQEQKTAFEKAIGKVLESGAELLLIPGDLFDTRTPDRETVSFVIKQFGRIPNTKILITPGNHDPYTVDSPYANETWPKNVFIFKPDSIRCVEVSVGGNGNRKYIRVYGRGCKGHFTQTTLVRSDDGFLPKLDENYTNILLMHADVAAKSEYNPVTVADLKEAGFNCAYFGHKHSFTEKDGYVYPGVLYPRGFDEVGACGIVKSRINDDHSIINEFEEIPARRYLEYIINTAELDEFGTEELCDEIKDRIRDTDNVYKIIFEGPVSEGRAIDCAAIKARLSEYLPGAEIENRTRAAADYNLIAKENSFRGIFIGKLLEMQRAAVADPKYDKETISLAMELGLRAFDGTLSTED